MEPRSDRRSTMSTWEVRSLFQDPMFGYYSKAEIKARLELSVDVGLDASRRSASVQTVIVAWRQRYSSEVSGRGNVRRKHF